VYSDLPRGGTASLLMLASVIVLGACSTAAERRAAQTTEIEKEAAKEIRQICALPEPAREAQIKKLEDAFGMTLDCAQD
jgi:hypothetical protein